MKTKNLDALRNTYRKASDEYANALIAEIKRIVNSLGNEYTLPSTDEDKIACGDPVFSARPTNIYIPSYGDILYVEVVCGYMDEDSYTELVGSLPTESLETLLKLLNQPIEE